MKTSLKLAIAACFAAAAIIFGVCVSGVFVHPWDIVRILASKLFGAQLPESISRGSVSIIWSLRFPRVIVAFLTGVALSVSGTVMQSVLRNPLASSYTLGVSSGASLGAGLVLVAGVTIPFLGAFSLPFFGLTAGLATVFLAVGLAGAFDREMSNNTIILTGVVFSLFINAVMTFVSAYNRERAQLLVFWQMGSFSGKGLSDALLLAPVVAICTLLLMRYHRELDVMTFGEEQAKSAGVRVVRTKWLLLGISAVMTGSAVAFAGVIGFIDLVAPHVVRRIFGPRHVLALPASAMIGGAFMVGCDVIARTVASPRELPVGAVTALVGAPFFVYVYFVRRKTTS